MRKVQKTAGRSALGAAGRGEADGGGSERTPLHHRPPMDWVELGRQIEQEAQVRTIRHWLRQLQAGPASVEEPS